LHIAGKRCLWVYRFIAWSREQGAWSMEIRKKILFPLLDKEGSSPASRRAEKGVGFLCENFKKIHFPSLTRRGLLPPAGGRRRGWYFYARISREYISPP